MIHLSQHADHPFAVAPCALSSEECQSLIDLSEEVGFRPAIINGQFNGPRGFTVRNGQSKHRAALEDIPLANTLWQRLARHIPAALDGKRVIGLNERLRFYRYDEAEHFSAHTDGYYVRDNGEQSLLTLMIYLNSDYRGGETVFSDLETVVTPQTGTVLLFDHRLWHEGLPIQSGRKYVLRTDVMYGTKPATNAGFTEGKFVEEQTNRPANR